MEEGARVPGRTDESLRPVPHRGGRQEDLGRLREHARLTLVGRTHRASWRPACPGRPENEGRCGFYRPALVTQERERLATLRGDDGTGETRDPCRGGDAADRIGDPLFLLVELVAGPVH